LRLLVGFDLKAKGLNRPETVHMSVEAMKLALADRDVYYADPNFESVPLQELLSDKYTKLRRPLIDLKHASLVQRPGDPRAGKALLDRVDARRGLGGPANDTTTCLVADAQRPVALAASFTAGPASGSEVACKVSTPGKATPTALNPGNARASR
jgi:gamma-glutamyltranspeptidase/glutathione hydrolase